MTNIFKDLGLTDKTLSALEKKGFEKPSPIQSEIIPLLLLNKKNIIGQAETGTGKTAAFGLPLIERLTPSKTIQALILVPTRELAVQVAEEINSLQSQKGLGVVPIYGGQSYTIQNNLLRRGADILVGTPGRVMDHMKKGTIKLDKISYFILDEADEMLNMGFIEDIKTIFTQTNKDKRVLLFSATMPREILSVVKKYMGEYDHISIKKEQMTTTQTEQTYVQVNDRDRVEALCRIMDHQPDFYGIVFCKTKADVDFLSAKLEDRGYFVQALHGDIKQKQRETILKGFKQQKIKILIATDVAARGIDVNDMTHVVNYGLPQDSEKYIHRVGRTGRAGKTGKAISIIGPNDLKKILYIGKITKTDIKKMEIPEIENVIENKQNKLMTNIKGVIEKGSFSKYLSFANKLLEDNKAEEIIAAMLKMSYQNELDEDNYRPIQKLNIVGNSGKVRLFVALGKIAGYSAKTLVDYIEKETGVRSRFIDDVYILNDFSFITVSDVDAEVIIRSFSKNKSGGRSLVSKAKENKSAGDSRGPRRFDRKSSGGYGKSSSGYGKSSSGYGKSSSSKPQNRTKKGYY
ncbi:DEAD/DEAH box helicase [Candidatus Gracilibacteria bacterium]|nr:DEAD/DEAH box helicase [Candidatus Gracilibacteria bacterium]